MEWEGEILISSNGRRRNDKVQFERFEMNFHGFFCEKIPVNADT